MKDLVAYVPSELNMIEFKISGLTDRESWNIELHEVPGHEPNSGPSHRATGQLSLELRSNRSGHCLQQRVQTCNTKLLVAKFASLLQQADEVMQLVVASVVARAQSHKFVRNRDRKSTRLNSS